MRTRAEHWTYAHLPTDGDAEIKPETAYVSVFLRSAHIADVRRGLKRLYGAVSSSLTLPTRGGNVAQFVTTVSPASLRDIDPDHLDRYIQLNHRLLGPVPYVGGDVEAEIGLFSIASSDLTEPYLALLESLSRAATVSVIGIALPFLEPMKQGFNTLAGGQNGSALEIGVSTTWQPLRAGTVVVVRTPASTPNTYIVDQDDGRLLREMGGAFVDEPYIVLEIRAERNRDDWTSIPELADSWAAVQREYRIGDPTRTHEALIAFRRAALTCNDLLFDDAIAVAERADAIYGGLGPPTTRVRGFGNADELPPLSSLSPFNS